LPHLACSPGHQLLLEHSTRRVILVEYESIRLATHDSRQTQASLAINRHTKAKLLMTGTITRNAIRESYAQLLLLYNSSTLFTSDARAIYEQGKDRATSSPRATRSGANRTCTAKASRTLPPPTTPPGPRCSVSSGTIRTSTTLSHSPSKSGASSSGAPSTTSSAKAGTASSNTPSPPRTPNANSTR